MNEINLAVTMYSPDSVPTSKTDNTMHVVMVPDDSGSWIHWRDYDDVTCLLQQRITYLENCLFEANAMLCR